MFYFLYELFYREDTWLSFLRLFKYISFRSAYAAITAFLIGLSISPHAIRLLRKRDIKSQVWRFDVMDEDHKVGTPTMGGIIIIISVLIPVLLWCDIRNSFVLITLMSLLWFGAIGFMDDSLKLARGDKAGLSSKQKLALQGLFGLFLAAIYLKKQLSPVPLAVMTKVYLPGFTEPIADLGIFFAIFIIFVIMGTSNSVNLTDGLDGLAIMPATLMALVFGVFSYVHGNYRAADYLRFEYLPGSGELMVFCAALAGAGMGFLWYNSYPAEVFMGDTGAIALGGVLGTICLLIKEEAIFIIAGGIFFIESLSVLLQKGICINLLGRRLFFRAPLHHTFQFRGWGEPKVVVRFWIISAILALLALSTLKVR